ncbi:ATP-binding cassette domain-containing protein [Streptomyces sp. NPDC059063]|uniref:ATP-binding cassette domain-containing protein n=1 Tax=unclassified Streptomyces TaxID=2593676 RepID=UPI0036B787EF
MTSTQQLTAWKLVRPALTAERGALARIVGWSLLEAVPVLLSGHLIAQAVDRGFLADAPGTGLLILCCYAFALILGSLGTRQLMPSLARVTESIRDRLVTHVVTTAMLQSQHGIAPDSSEVARTTRQTESARQITAGLLMSARTVVFSSAAVALGLSTIAPLIAVVCLVCLLLAGALLVNVSRRLRRRYGHFLACEEELAEHSGRVLEALRDIAACGASVRAARDVGRVVDKQAAASVATAWAGSGRIAVIIVGARLPLLVTLLLAPRLVASGSATPGTILGALTYLVTGLEPALRSIILTVGNMGVQLHVLLLSLAKRAVPPPPPPGRSHTVGATSLSLHHVTFSYGPHAAPVVVDLSLRIEAGEHVAIAGPSGAGKSTLARLLAGLETPDSGEVRLGERGLPQFAPSVLRSTMALIPQESYVFAGTVRENLCYLRPSSQPATPAELEHAITLFDLEETVTRAGGVDGVIEQPLSLPQGQRQLIVLARAYLSGARVLILDEATCHLDASHEARAEEALMNRPNTTLIVIAHRTSSVGRARKVVVVGAEDRRAAR